MTRFEQWEKKVLSTPGAAERVAQIEDELRLASGLTRLREAAGVTQTELARRIGVRQPRIAAIERSRNVTFDVLERYVAALGGSVEVTVVKGGKKIPLVSGHSAAKAARADAAKTFDKTTANLKKKAAKSSKVLVRSGASASKTRAKRANKSKSS